MSVGISVFRAPTDNDRGRGPVDYWGIDASDVGPLGVGRGEAGISHAMRWERARLHLLRRRLVSIEEDGVVRRVVERWAPPAAQFGVTLTWEYAPVRIGEEGPNALSVSLRVVPYGTWLPRVPRLGLRLELPGSTWHATWLGDTMIGYADMSVPGARGCGSGDACDLWDVCVRPQEGGHRQGLEALSLRGEARGVPYPPRPRPWDGASAGGASANWPRPRIGRTCPTRSACFCGSTSSRTASGPARAAPMRGPKLPGACATLTSVW